MSLIDEAIGVGVECANVNADSPFIDCDAIVAIPLAMPRAGGHRGSRLCDDDTLRGSADDGDVGVPVQYQIHAAGR